LQKEARIYLSQAAKIVVEEIVPKDVYKKRKNCGLYPSDRVAWETIIAIQEDIISSFSADGKKNSFLFQLPWNGCVHAKH
jgi:hypothetical protein